MWEVHPISQPIHWEGKEEAEMTHFLFLPGEQLNLCLLLAARSSEPNTSEQVQWKLSKSWCNNKDHVGTYKHKKASHLNEGIFSF